MWILFSLLCMVALTASEIIGKKAVGSDDLAPLRLRISVMATSVVLSILMYALGLGESGLAPWRLMVQYPLLPLSVCCTAVSDFLYIYSLRYVGMTIMEAISALEGIAIFLGMLLIYTLSGQLNAVKDMLTPARLLCIGIVMVFTYLLPNIKTFSNRKSILSQERLMEKHTIVLGILIALLAVILSSADSLISDVLLDGEMIGVADFIITAYFSFAILLPVFCAAALQKRKQHTSTHQITNRYSVLYTVLYVVYQFFGSFAASFDAVRSEVMYLTYPLISILGARLILKEKYTGKQTFCIWMITVAAIAFCLMDYLA